MFCRIIILMLLVPVAWANTNIFLPERCDFGELFTCREYQAVDEAGYFAYVELANEYRDVYVYGAETEWDLDGQRLVLYSMT